MAFYMVIIHNAAFQRTRLFALRCKSLVGCLYYFTPSNLSHLKLESWGSPEREIFIAADHPRPKAVACIRLRHLSSFSEYFPPIFILFDRVERHETIVLPVLRVMNVLCDFTVSGYEIAHLLLSFFVTQEDKDS